MCVPNLVGGGDAGGVVYGCIPDWLIWYAWSLTGGLGKDLVDLLASEINVTFAGCFGSVSLCTQCFTVYILSFWNMHED